MHYLFDPFFKLSLFNFATSFKIQIFVDSLPLSFSAISAKIQNFIGGKLLNI